MRISRDEETLEPLRLGDVDEDPNATGTIVVGATGTRRSSATFTRLTLVHPAMLVRLPAWWRAAANGGQVQASRALVLDALHSEGGGTWHMRGSLRSAWLRRQIPVELQLWPRFGAWTKVSLEPRRNVRIGPRYFRLGHRALDALVERLKSELPPL